METRGAPPSAIDLATRPDWTAVFGRHAPLEVEVGAGRGGFALDHAAASPGIDLVAIEVRRAFAAEIEERRTKRGLTNLVVLQADARAVLAQLFAPRSIDVLHVQFPDPWWKRRHHARRLVEEDFSVLLYNLLRPGGQLEVRTDVAPRGEEMAAALESVGFVNLAGPRALSERRPGEVPSTRERVYLARNQPVYRYRFTRDGTPPRAAGAPSPSKVGPELRRR